MAYPYPKNSRTRICAGPLNALFGLSTKPCLTISDSPSAEWFASYSHPEVRRLALGRALSDINASFQFRAKHAAPAAASTTVTSDDSPPPTSNAALKLAVLSVHDTSLAGILATLDVFDDRWPGFTSFIEFQLLKQEVGDGAKSSGLMGTVKGMLGGKATVKPEEHCPFSQSWRIG
jgi:hypothetical protein